MILETVNSLSVGALLPPDHFFTKLPGTSGFVTQPHFPSTFFWGGTMWHIRLPKGTSSKFSVL